MHNSLTRSLYFERYRERDEQIHTQYVQEHLSISEIAEFHGLTGERIRQILSKQGVERKRNEMYRRYPHSSPERFPIIVCLRSSNKSPEIVIEDIVNDVKTQLGQILAMIPAGGTVEIVIRAYN